MTGTDWTDGLATPPELADRLLAGTVGREHLLGTAAVAQKAAAAAPGKTALARRHLLLLAAALEEDSLHGPTAAAVVNAAAALSPECNPVSPAFVALSAKLATLCTIPANVGYYQRLTAKDDRNRLRRYLENECRSGQNRLFWLHVALRRAVLFRDFDWGESCLRAALPPALSPLAAKLAGDLALAAGRPILALEHYTAAADAVPWPTGLFRLGLAAWQAGDRARALAHLSGIARRHPWHVSAWLAAADILLGRDTALAPFPGRMAICCYTFAKAAALDRTLAGLFASDTGTATITVLDNASPDDTPAVLAAWTERIGADRLRCLRLPVNIGAPAARNWLLREPGPRQADYVAFLDDDVDLPGDWLARLGAAAAAYPEAGVWGCRVTDAANPAIAQGVGATLLLPSDGGSPEAEPKLSDAQAEVFESGVFSHLRPCLSVMGCCHVFRRDRLLACGDFDIRFSPSQCDDVDHDLRLALAGSPAVYQGHLAVRHRRPAPILAPLRPDQLAGAEAHRYKLLAKHKGHFEELGAIMRRVLVADLETKRRYLAAAGLLET